jgi:hypothetical protein
MHQNIQNMITTSTTWLTTMASHNSRQVKEMDIEIPTTFPILSNHCHCDVPRQSEMATLAVWVLYQRTKFKFDPDTFDSHCLHLVKDFFNLSKRTIAGQALMPI